MSIAEEQGYSATVELELRVNGVVFPLWEVGPSHCVLTSDEQVPTALGEILVVIDGHVQRTSVEILGQSEDGSRTVRYRRIS